MVGGAPRDETDAALAALGIEGAAAQALWGDEEPNSPAPTVEVWPEHEPALRLFIGMRTQWRMGFGGPVGLDYAVLPLVARAVGLRRGMAHKAFADVQAMEAAALEWMAEKRGD